MTAELLSDLARVKVLFQLRAVAAVMGVEKPTELTTSGFVRLYRKNDRG